MHDDRGGDGIGSSPVLAQGTFTPLGVKNTYVASMSADGTVLVGVWGNEGPAWRWTPETGVVDIGSVSQQVKVSGDGRTIVGTAKDSQGIKYAAIWQGGKDWRTLPRRPTGGSWMAASLAAGAFRRTAQSSSGCVGLRWRCARFPLRRGHWKVGGPG